MRRSSNAMQDVSYAICLENAGGSALIHVAFAGSGMLIA